MFLPAGTSAKGNQKFTRVNGLPEDIGTLKTQADREKFAAIQNSQKPPFKLRVAGGGPGNYLLEIP